MILLLSNETFLYMSSLCTDINMGKPNRMYDETTLKEAIGKIRCGKITCGKAAKVYHIPKATLQFNMKKGNDGFLKRGKPLKLHANEEKSLAEYCKWMAQHNMPVTYEILGMISAQILKKRDGSKDNLTLSHSWCVRFVKRHRLSARTPRQVDRGRIAAAASFEEIKNYFEVLKDLDDKEHFDPSNIYNMDEVGWSRQQVLQRPVLVEKGVKQASLQQVFTNNHITTVHTISASGKCLPPLIIFSKNIPSTFTPVPFHLPFVIQVLILATWILKHLECGFRNHS